MFAFYKILNLFKKLFSIRLLANGFFVIHFKELFTRITMKLHFRLAQHEIEIYLLNVIRMNNFRLSLTVQQISNEA